MAGSQFSWRAPPEVVEALKHGRQFGRFIRAKCPICDPEGRKGASLSGGEKGWNCWREQCEQKLDIIERSRSGATYSGTLKSRSEIARDEERTRNYVIELFERSSHIRNGDIVDRYLRGRRLEPLHGDWPSDLRFISLKHRDGGRWPVMIAAVRNVGGSIVAVHRTFLDPKGIIYDKDGRPIPPGGKAPVKPSRMALAPVEGHAIWLGEVTDTLILSEGIESGLAASKQEGFPAWACISAHGMATVVLPQGLRRLLLAHDRDPVGRKAMYQLRNRVMETRPEIAIGMVPLPRDGARDPADLFP